MSRYYQCSLVAQVRHYQCSHFWRSWWIAMQGWTGCVNTSVEVLVSMGLYQCHQCYWTWRHSATVLCWPGWDNVRVIMSDRNFGTTQWIMLMTSFAALLLLSYFIAKWTHLNLVVSNIVTSIWTVLIWSLYTGDHYIEVAIKTDCSNLIKIKGP